MIAIIRAIVSADSIFFQSIYSYPGINGLKYYIGIFYWLLEYRPRNVNEAVGEYILDFECPDWRLTKFHDKFGMSRAVCVKPASYNLVKYKLLDWFYRPEDMVI